MRRLEGAAELLDGPLDEETLAGNLRDLARFNRWLGGADLSWRALSNVLRSTSPSHGLRLLDVGTGWADIPAELARRARDASRRLDIVATDIRSEIVAMAKDHLDEPGIEVRLAKSDLSDEADRSFDVVHASMVIHHLDPEEAKALLRQLARVSRSVVIVNDLDRGWLWWAGAWLFSHVFTANRYTRHDAPRSVRRAYRPGEMRDLAKAAGLTQVGQHWTWPRYRYAITFAPRSSIDA